MSRAKPCVARRTARSRTSCPASRQRQILDLVLFHELSVAEAGRVLGISIGSARRHNHRAKERLRRSRRSLLRFATAGVGLALAQARRLMEIETRVKARHLALLVRTRNTLSTEQQARLGALRTGR